MKPLVILFCFIFSVSIFSHSGRTIKSGPKKGCHEDRKLGEFHCHGGVSKVETDKQNKYSRKKFKHWTDTDKNCLNTRHEILKIRSLVKVKISSCKVVEGKWNDFYFREILTSPSQIDIDHVVPLKNAWESGASLWSNREREKFANDPENLVITNSHYNRKKQAKTPLEWYPIEKSYTCKYLKQWIAVKTKYALKINPQIISEYKRIPCE
ncbi:HNH endonuclease [Halobacteriovorax sp. JY17]|uniref:HNH endonuclease n=1 Tax=Halobacteriovorax sp. JY17 TaxID=2014617 RepID=UPI000C4A52BA|nr:HNH endonuclease [Halobacteriovorax sp. JY17]PIK13568.1 MAG: HNH endonuclease [Halobacteriovorax sp. JY17]